MTEILHSHNSLDPRRLLLRFGNHHLCLTAGVLWTWLMCARRTLPSLPEQAYTPIPHTPSSSTIARFQTARYLSSHIISITAPSTPWLWPMFNPHKCQAFYQPLVPLWNESPALSRAPGESHQWQLSALWRHQTPPMAPSSPPCHNNAFTLDGCTLSVTFA